MKLSKIHFILCLLLFFSCSEKKKADPTIEQETSKSSYLEAPEFQIILDSANVKGAIVVYDLRKNQYYSNDFKWAKIQRLPASTFKIPNSIIALETGVVENDSTLFKWGGERRFLKIWEQDLVLKDAFHFSCVPCYQEVARKIGIKRMNEYLAKLGYGEMNVDSTNIDSFWLEGDSKINQLQQIDFLRRFYESKLPISNRTENIMKKMMIMDKKADFTLSGKTGLANGNEENNGWFIGFAETAGQTLFFATNIEPSAGLDAQQFLSSRKEVTLKAIKQISAY